MGVAAIISDFDGVLSGYDLDRRLAELAALSGLDAAAVHARLWASGFEDDADAGRAGDAASYLAAFGKRLGCPVSRDQWVAARLAAMREWPDMIGLMARLGRRHRLALLTNNGPLMRDCFADMARATHAVFAGRTFFSCDFNTKKPDAAIYRAVAERIGVEPQACLFIDDKAANVDGARRAGMAAIRFTGRDSLESALGRAGVAG